MNNKPPLYQHTSIAILIYSCCGISLPTLKSNIKNICIIHMNENASTYTYAQSRALSCLIWYENHCRVVSQNVKRWTSQACDHSAQLTLVRPNVKLYKTLYNAMGCTDSAWSLMCVYVLRVSWLVVSAEVMWKRPFNIASSFVLDWRSASWWSWYKYYGSKFHPPSCVSDKEALFPTASLDGWSLLASAWTIH